MAAATRVPCVGVVILDDERRLLLVLRGYAPSAGRWSIPGGRVQPGETLEQAAVREAREETGLDVTIGRVVGRVELAGVGDEVYDVTDFAASVLPTSGPASGPASSPAGTAAPAPAVVTSVREPVAGDDAFDVRWVGRDELHRLPTTPGLADTLEAWGIWS